MLITFSCPAYASITLFGDVGLKLIKLMGHSGTVPGALLADDLPAALAHLQAAVAADSSQDEDSPGVAETTAEEPAVSLSHRALPLLELLEAAVAQHCNVMWDSGS